MHTEQEQQLYNYDMNAQIKAVIDRFYAYDASLHGKSRNIMIKIYGLKTCPYCDFIKPQIVGKEDQFQYIDIGSHVKYMHSL